MFNENQKVNTLRRHKGRKSDSHADTETNNSHDYKQLARKMPDGKTIILNENIETNTKTAKRAEKIITFLCFLLVFCLVASVVFSALFRYSLIDDLALHFNKESRISNTDNYNFGSFDGFVTIGDSLEKAVEILGFPNKAIDNLYYYDNSYIIIENQTVVGYYKNSSDDFRVTVGFKQIDGKITKGDNAARVVSLLGSPAYYLKHDWIYENISHKFEYINSDDVVTKLTVHFDENYRVSGYVFSE